MANLFYPQKSKNSVLLNKCNMRQILVEISNLLDDTVALSIAYCGEPFDVRKDGICRVFLYYSREHRKRRN